MFISSFMNVSFFFPLSCSLSLSKTSNKIIMRNRNETKFKWYWPLDSWFEVLLYFQLALCSLMDGCWCYFIVCAKLNSHRWIKWWMVLNSHFSALLMRWNFICQLTYRLCDNCKFCYSFDRKFGFQNGFESFAHWNAIYVAMVNQMVT